MLAGGRKSTTTSKISGMRVEGEEKYEGKSRRDEERNRRNANVPREGGGIGCGGGGIGGDDA